MMPEYWYRGYGLRYCSDIPLPGYRAAEPGGDADIRIRLSDAARLQWHVSGATKADSMSFFAAPDGGYVMQVKGICDYWVRGGTEISVTPGPDADLPTTQLYLIGGVMGMTFHQRGVLVLHGATIRHLDRAIIILGDSGDGKSTLAAWLGREGYAMLCDDIMPLWPCKGGGFEVWPGSQLTKLWPDAISALGVDPGGFEQISGRVDKLYFPSPISADDAPLPLDEVIVLAAEDGLARPALDPITGLVALRSISEEIYRPKYSKQLGHEALNFQQCCDLAATSRVGRLRHPWDEVRIGESVALLRAQWNAPMRAADGAN